MTMQMRDIAIEPKPVASIDKPLSYFTWTAQAFVAPQEQFNLLFHFRFVQGTKFPFEDAGQRMRTGFRRTDTKHLAASWMNKTIAGNFGIMFDELTG